MILSVISGLIVGLVLGWALQSGGFCMNTAFRSVVFREDRSILRAWVLVLLISVPAVTLLEEFGILYPARAPFTPLTLAVGGLVFGAGMVWAGGCVSGSYYRASKGMVGSFLALLGFAAGALAMTSGALAPLRSILAAPEWTVAGEIPTLGHVLPSNPWIGRWIVLAVLLPPGIIFLIRAPGSRFRIGWHWALTGAVVAVCSVAAWYFSSLEGRDYGLSLVQPTVAWNAFLLFGDAGGLNWTAWMLAGLPVGAFLSAWKGKDLKWRQPSARQSVIQFGGGVAMGVGAVLAGGCNIGHGITGVSTLALSSVVATLFTMFGNWGATALLWKRSRMAAASV